MREQRLRVRLVPAAVAGFALIGCGSTARVAVADEGGSGVIAPPPAKPGTPDPAPRVDWFAPRVTPFRPAADDPLRSLGAWDAATSAQRRARAEALAARLPGFAFKEMKTFECGAERHEIAVFLREPVQTGDDMELVLLPCGPPASAESKAEAEDGGDVPEERIAADAPFLIARTEVSTSAWLRSLAREITEPDRAPVSGVSYTDAIRFCVRAGLDLPSSAQWEFACSGGATTKFFFGGDPARLCDFGWTAGNSGDHVHPPAEKLPNAFGLFDVYGNLREWCRDGQARHVCPRVRGQGFDGGTETIEGNGREQFQRKHANLGFRPVYVIPDEKAWDEWPHRVVRRLSAKGVRTYRLENAADGRPAWKLLGFQAELFDGQREVGKHGAGPSGPFWKVGTDEVTARPLHERSSPNAGAVPELQLIVKSAASSGAFARVTLIERLNTTGGIAPAIGADHRVGEEVSVPYTADYVFLDTTSL